MKILFYQEHLQCFKDMLQELKQLYIENNLKHTKNKNIKIPINIIDSPRRKYSVYIGATVLSNVYNEPANEADWISKRDWEESGPKIIQKKCQSLFR